MGSLFFPFPMASFRRVQSHLIFQRSSNKSNSAPFSVLPILGYVVAALLVAYLSSRGYRYINDRRNATVALPKPVSGSAAKSGFSIGRTTGWDWRRWTFPVPWSRKPTVPSTPTKGKAAAAASARHLKVDLLPTIGLPPPPESLPTPPPTAQLVDLGSPPLHTPLLTTAPSSSGFTASPRTPSPARFWPNPLASHKTLQHSSLYRPPSPHSLLATTPPPKQHKRSRSLGGVPVRRLSGGQSSLRNKVDVEMHEFLPGHMRGTSGEQLLIDFSSSGSSEEERTEARISPAASDIGVLPTSAAYNKVVQTRPVPLLDLGGDETYGDSSLTNADQDSDDDAWKWFGPSAPSTVRVYEARPAVQRVQTWTATATGRVGTFLGGQGKLAFPIPLPFPRTEKLIDIQSSEDNEGQELVQLEPLKTDFNFGRTLDTRMGMFDDTLVDATSDEDLTHVLVDLEDTEAAPAIDPFGDDYAVEQETSYSQPSPTHLVGVSMDDVESQLSGHSDSPLPESADVDVLEGNANKDAEVFHHPLEDFAQVDVKPLHVEPVSEDTARSGLLFAEAESVEEVQPTPLVDTEVETDVQRVLTVIEPEMVTSFSPSLSPLVHAHATILDFAADAPRQDSPSDPQAQPQVAWSWDEVEDPWGDHVIVPEQHEVEVDATAGVTKRNDNDDLIYFGQENVTLDEVVEMSPGGSLMPTAVDAGVDDEVPILVLEPESEVQLNDPPIVDVYMIEDQEEDSTPRPTSTSAKVELPSITLSIPSTSVPVIIVDEEGIEETSEEIYPDPDLLPLPELLTSVDARLEDAIVSEGRKDSEVSERRPAAPSQMPTPPASPPISPLRFSPVSPRPTRVAKSLPASPKVSAKCLAVAGSEQIRSRSRPASPRIAIMLPPAMESEEQEDNETPIALAKPLWAVGPAERVKFEVKDGGAATTETPTADKIQPSTSLPGSFPDEQVVVSTASASSPSGTTIAARLATSAAPALFRPSAREIIRSPLDIALAMQLRPGLGVGADPAWMVRFLMTMFGWFAVVVSGQGEF